MAETLNIDPNSLNPRTLVGLLIDDGVFSESDLEVMESRFRQCDSQTADINLTSSVLTTLESIVNGEYYSNTSTRIIRTDGRVKKSFEKSDVFNDLKLQVKEKTKPKDYVWNALHVVTLIAAVALGLAWGSAAGILLYFQSENSFNPKTKPGPA